MASIMGYRRPAMLYEVDEKVLCFHGELLYEAKILEAKQDSPGAPWSYHVHYKGWKNTWDDWVENDRLRKMTDENRETAQALKRQYMESMKPHKPTAVKKKGLPSDLGSARGSEERSAPAAATGRGLKRNRNADLEEEESFLSRPAIKIPIPDPIKSLLVDDWEEVTKNLCLIHLPCNPPAFKIIDDYQNFEKQNRFSGSAEEGLLEEVCAGLKEYFEMALGRMLLYKFERQQLLEAKKSWEDGQGQFKDRKGPGEVYGAEHLGRLLVNMPEMIAQTNMDGQSVNRLREEMTKFLQWLSKNRNTYFTGQYEAPGQEYKDKATTS